MSCTSLRLRQAIWERDNGVCGLCGQSVVFDRLMHVDRINATIRGYADWSNLQATHARCNIRKGSTERRQYPSPTLVQVSIPRDMMTAIDALAAKARVKRATMVRTMLAELLDSMKGAVPRSTP